MLDLQYVACVKKVSQRSESGFYPSALVSSFKEIDRKEYNKRKVNSFILRGKQCANIW